MPRSPWNEPVTYSLTILLFRGFVYPFSTMQHWHVYRFWNELLFEELYVAYLNGRATKDPSEFWYESELGFFDNYIIPLAKKLSQCGVFGVSSDEFLNYAESNRKEWERRGREVVTKMKTRLEPSSKRK